MSQSSSRWRQHMNWVDFSRILNYSTSVCIEDYLHSRAVISTSLEERLNNVRRLWTQIDRSSCGMAMRDIVDMELYSYLQATNI